MDSPVALDTALSGQMVLMHLLEEVIHGDTTWDLHFGDEVYRATVSLVRNGARLSAEVAATAGGPITLWRAGPTPELVLVHPDVAERRESPFRFHWEIVIVTPVSALR